MSRVFRASAVRFVAALAFLLSLSASAQFKRTPIITSVSGSDGLSKPQGMAIDDQGNVYIADTGNNRVRKLDAKTGLLTTVAGTGTAGYRSSDDGAAATAAQLNGPEDVALNAFGVLFIADTQNHRVRRVDLSTGLITTFAGNGGTAYNQQELGFATTMAINLPAGVSVDPLGGVAISDAGNHRVFYVAGTTAAYGVQSGKIGTIVGIGTSGYTTPTAEENVNPRTVHLTNPGKLAWGVEGLYVADRGNGRVRLMTTGYVMKTVIGNGGTAYSAADDGGVAMAVSIGDVGSLYLAPDRQIYFTEAGSAVLARYSPTTGKVAYLAGNGSAGQAQDTLRSLATFSGPAGVAMSALGDVYVSDTQNNQVRVIRQTGGALIYPAAAVGSAGATNELVLTATADVTLTAVTVQPSMSGGAGAAATEFTLGTGGNCALNTRVAAGTVCRFPFTFQPAFAGRRNIAVRFETSAGAQQFGLSGFGSAPQPLMLPGVQTVVAGVFNQGGYVAASDGGPATSAKINAPLGIVVAQNGDLYFADRLNQRVRKVAAATGIITTVAGNGNQGYNAAHENVAATTASVWEPSAVAFDPAGNLYLTEQQNWRVRRVDAVTGKIVTVYADGLQQPQGLAIDIAGNIYIGDTGGRKVVRIDADSGVASIYAGRGFASSSNSNPLEGGAATGASMSLPQALAVDDNGNVYINSNSLVFRVAGNNQSITTLTPASGSDASFTQMRNMFLDGAGNLVYAESSRLAQYNLSTRVLTTLSTGTGTPWSVTAGMARDALGNLYLTSGLNYVINKLNTQTSTFAFNTVGVGNTSTDSPKTLRVTNSGDQPLSLASTTQGSNPSVSQNFGIATSASATTCPVVSSTSPTTKIGSGKTCLYGLNFTPTTGGTLSGSLTLSDDALNVAGAQQSIALSGTATETNPVTSITITGLSNQVAGTAQTVTVTAFADSAVATQYRGTVQFSSTDAKADLPAAYTFTAADAGIHVFTVTLKTATDRQKVTVQDVAKSSLTAVAQANISAGPVSTASITGGTPQSKQVNQAFDGLGVVVRDAYGNGVPNVTVTFTAPTSGASATAATTAPKTDFDGTASVFYTANGTTGSYSVMATVPGYATPLVFSLTNTPVAASMVMTPSSTTSRYGVAVRLDASFTPSVIGGKDATGTITFYEGTTVIGTGTLSSGRTSILLQGQTVGVHNYTASYAGDGNYPAFTAVAVTSPLTVIKAEPAVQPTSYVQTVARPGSVTINVVNFNANNAISSAYIRPGGVLNYALRTYGATTGGVTGTLPLVDGVATLPIAADLAAKRYSLVVSYAGDERYESGGDPKEIDLTVTATPATIRITNLNQVFDGTPKPVTVTTEPAGLSYAVSYSDSGTAPTRAGAYRVLVSITDPNYSGTQSATLVITAGPALILWSNPAGIPYGTPLSDVQLNARTAGVDGTYTFTPAAGTILPPGRHTLNVTFTPNDPTYPPSTASTTIDVGKGTLIVKAADAGRRFGEANPALTATVTGAAAGDAFTATATTTATATSPVGTYTIVPAVSGANLDRYTVQLVNGTLTVTGGVSTVALITSSASVPVGTAFTLTATVAGGSVMPTGTVAFFNGMTSLGVSPLTNGVATLSVSTLPVGTYSITAQYSGDGTYVGSTSAILLQNVTAAADYSISVNPTSITVRRGQSATATFTVTPVNGYTGTVNLSCGSLPAYARCVFAPSAVAVNGAPATSVLTFSTTAPAASQLHTNAPWRMGVVGVAMAGMVCLLGFARRRAVPRLLVVLLGVAALSLGVTGCGTSSSSTTSNSNTTPAGSYTVAVGASAGTGSGGKSVNLTINIID